MQQRKIKLVECPRDAMQGWPHFIPTAQKIAYLNTLLKVGFDVLDFGSFVSAKAIPQLADTKEVLNSLVLNPHTKMLAIVANTRGAIEALEFPQIDILGFPFSISETFQMRNTNKTIEASLSQVAEMQELCVQKNRTLLVYISMGFGNPYGDPFNADITIQWVDQLAQLGITNFALADTVGLADKYIIEDVFAALIPAFPKLNIGAHFHSKIENWQEKVEAAYVKGCTQFDSSLKGIGGCPMAEDVLVGNIATENMIAWARQKEILPELNLDALSEAMLMAQNIFHS